MNGRLMKKAPGFFWIFFMILLMGYGCGGEIKEPEIRAVSADLIEITFDKTTLPLRITYQVVIQGESPPGDLSIKMQSLNSKALVIIPEFTADNSQSAQVRGLTIYLTPLKKVAVESMYHEGFQSWSAAYLWKGEFFESLSPADISSGEWPSDTQHPYLSWWMGGWGNDRISLVAGAVESHVFKTRVLLSKTGTLIIIEGEDAGEVKEVKAGETFRFDTLTVITHRTIEKSLVLYSQLLQQMNERLTPPYIPAGWNSWNTFFENITSGVIIRQAEKVKKIFPEWVTPVIQIDDGWEIAWGVWNAKSEFLAGYSSFGEFLSRITGEGLRAGIWTAPFLYSASLTLPWKKPEMFVKDASGNLLLYHHPTGETFAVVDPTSPDGLNFLRETFSTLRKLGFTYFKIDFLFAPLMGSSFFDGSTPVEAYRKGLKIIKESIGADSYILACGAPLLPTAGLAHGIRLGFDIAVGNLPYGWHMVKNEFRNVLWRFFWNSIFEGDPDTVLLRNLSESEARLFLIASVFTGKIFALGDDLLTLDSGKLQVIEDFINQPFFQTVFSSRTGNNLLVKSILPPSLYPPADIITQSFFPSLYRAPEVALRKIDENSFLLGLFNWENFELKLAFNISEMTEDDGPYELSNIFTGEKLTGNSIARRLLPHSAELWLVKRIPAR